MSAQTDSPCRTRFNNGIFNERRSLPVFSQHRTSAKMREWAGFVPHEPTQSDPVVTETKNRPKAASRFTMKAAAALFLARLRKPFAKIVRVHNRHKLD